MFRFLPEWFCPMGLKVNRRASCRLIDSSLRRSWSKCQENPATLLLEKIIGGFARNLCCWRLSRKGKLWRTRSGGNFTKREKTGNENSKTSSEKQTNRKILSRYWRKLTWMHSKDKDDTKHELWPCVGAEIFCLQRPTDSNKSEKKTVLFYHFTIKD